MGLTNPAELVKTLHSFAMLGHVTPNLSLLVSPPVFSFFDPSYAGAGFP